MIAQAGKQFDGVGRFHQVVAGAAGKGLRFRLRLFSTCQNDDGHIAQRFVATVFLHQRPAVDVRHMQVLQYDRWLMLARHGKRHPGIGTEPEGDIFLIGDHPRHKFPDHILIVDQENPDCSRCLTHVGH